MFPVNRSALLQKLEAVYPGISVTNILEQSGSFIFKDGQILTYNGAVSCSIESPLGKEFTAAVQADPLLKILRKRPEDEIELEVTENELIIHGKKRRSGVRMDAQITLPIEGIEKPQEWRKLHEDFTEAIKLVQDCAHTDEEKWMATCIHIHPKWVEATDNDQIARYKVKTGVPEPTLVKRDYIKHIVALDMTEMSLTSRWIHFRNPTGLVFSCERHHEQYFDLSRFIEQKEGNKAKLPRGLADDTEMAEIFSGEDADHNVVLVEIAKGGLRVTGKGTQGWHQAVKRLPYEGESLSFVISPRLLIEITKKYSECIISPEKIRVEGEKFVYLACLERREDNGKAEV